jgi:hypothetical protein
LWTVYQLAAGERSKNNPACARMIPRFEDSSDDPMVTAALDAIVTF